MTESTDKPTAFVRVEDRAGNQYICPVEALKDPARATEEELENCFDSIEEAFTSRLI
ncbi:MAG: hypothetical protein P8182_19000 [Deltaproteobacteria bacterium]